jgi:hypothetical protein
MDCSDEQWTIAFRSSEESFVQRDRHMVWFTELTDEVSRAESTAMADRYKSNRETYNLHPRV